MCFRPKPVFIAKSLIINHKITSAAGGGAGPGGRSLPAGIYCNAGGRGVKILDLCLCVRAENLRPGSKIQRMFVSGFGLATRENRAALCRGRRSFFLVLRYRFLAVLDSRSSSIAESRRTANKPLSGRCCRSWDGLGFGYFSLADDPQRDG